MWGGTRAGAGGAAVVVSDGDDACKARRWRGGPAAAASGYSGRYPAPLHRSVAIGDSGKGSGA